jgi:hypothetical protein
MDMIVDEATKRLNCDVILDHPFFWSFEKIFEFFLLIDKISDVTDVVKEVLEQNSKEILKNDWKITLEEENLIVSDNSDGNKVQDLIRVMCSEVSFQIN